MMSLKIQADQEGFEYILWTKRPINLFLITMEICYLAPIQEKNSSVSKELVTGIRIINQNLNQTKYSNSS